MNKKQKTKKELLEELSSLRRELENVQSTQAEMKKVKEALNESEEKYRTLLDNLADGYYEVDLAGNLTFFNNALVKTFSYPRDELMGMNNRQYTDAVNAKKMYQTFNRVYRTGEPAEGVRIETITKDKTRRDLDLSISLLKDVSGKTVGFRGIARDITDLIQIQNNLREREERYRTIIETMEEGYYENDLAGNLTFVNEAMARGLGYSRAEMLGMNNRQYIDAENSKIIYQGFNQLYRTGKLNKGIQYEVITRDGEKKYVETFPSLIRDQAGNPVGFRGITRDITDLIRIQNDLKASEERYRTIIETIEDGYYEVDLKGNYTFFNEALVRIFEYPRHELMGMNNRQYTDTANAKILYQAFNRVYQSGEPFKGIRYEMITKNNKRKNLEVSVSLIRDASGKPVGFRGISRDITDLIQTQRALQESEERYRTIIETIEDGYYEVDTAGNLTYFNDVMVGIHEYPRDELMGMNNQQYTDAENAKILFKAFNRVFRTGEPSKGTHYEIITKSGGRKNLESSVSLIRDTNGNSIGFRGIVRDVTELKQVQAGLKESEEKYRTIIETIEDGYYEVDMEGNLTFFNDALTRVNGYPRDEMMGMHGRDYTDAETAERLTREFSQVYRTRTPSKGIQYEVITKNGERKNVETSISLIRDPLGKPIGFRGIARDITEIRRKEKALQTSEERFRIAAESSTDFIYEWDLESGHIDWFGVAVERLGHILGELPVTATDFDKMIYHEDSERILEAIRRHLRQREPYKEEYCLVGKDENIIHVKAAGMGVRNETGRVYKWIGAISDITEQKKAEQALQASEERFRVAAESSNDFIFEWDLKSGQLQWFGSVVERLGHILGELPQSITAWDNLIHPEDYERLSRAVRRHLKQGEPYREEYRMIGRGGDIVHVKGAGMGLRNEDGRVYKWIGAVSDITERKKTEEELKQSFEKVRKAMGGIIQAMALTVESKDPYTAGHQQRVSNLARTIAQEMGLSKDQVEAIRLAGVVHDLGKISIPAEILSKPTKLSDLEFSLIKGHPQTSYDILKDIDFPWPIAQIALQHHERMNGSGYPAGLKGDEIFKETQVLMVADVVEAIASHRPYRPAFGFETALEEISKNKGILYDEAAVDACLRLFREKGFSLD